MAHQLRLTPIKIGVKEAEAGHPTTTDRHQMWLQEEMHKERRRVHNPCCAFWLTGEAYRSLQSNISGCIIYVRFFGNTVIKIF